MSNTAVMVDGAFYLHMAKKLWGDKSPEVRAEELHKYVLSHITIKRSAAEENGKRSLYRIFYYDCPPANGINILQPWNGHNTTFNAKDGSGKWRKDFQASFSCMRKVAMRMGTVSYRNARYVPDKKAMGDLISGKRAFSDLGKDDFTITGIKQEGVDMRLGIDIASLAAGRIVDQVILIAGDCDFVPVMKSARRAGVDFILDPMGHAVSEEMRLNADAVEDLSRSKVLDDSDVPNDIEGGQIH